MTTIVTEPACASAEPTTDGLLYTNQFKVKEINPEGKQFAQVSRIVFEDVKNNNQLRIDINTSIYRLDPQQSVEIVLCANDSEQERYEYVMYGIVLAAKPKSNVTTVHVSFGGLLMELQASSNDAVKLVQNTRLYLLMKKIST
jgi:hypothetical protein